MGDFTKSPADLPTAINDFFTAWYTALQYASRNTQLTLLPIVNELDPAKSTNGILSDTLTALTVGLALIPGIGQGILGIDASTVAAGTALLTGLQQAPRVAKSIWPAGTADTKTIQLAALDQSLGQAAQGLSNQFNAAVELIMTDVPSSIGFSQSGAFSGQTSLSIPKATNGLTAALDTYVLSLTMQGNGYRSEFWYNATIDDFEKGYASNGYASNGCGATIGGNVNGCQCTPDNNGICQAKDDNAWYWNSANQHIFELSPNGRSLPVLGAKLMTDIIINQWSTLGLLFDSALNCTIAGGSTTPLNINPDGSLNLACVSHLSMQCPVFAGIGEVLSFAGCTPQSSQSSLGR